MSENPNLPYTVEAEEKVASVMAYTQNTLVWGEVVVRQILRVSTWLRTNSAPDDVRIYNARVLFTSGGSFKPMFLRETHIATTAVQAFHLLPPASDPVDYDPSEPNRRMEPITAIVSNFKIEGFMRMSTKADLSKYLDVSKETYLPIYEAEISAPTMPSFGLVKVPYLIVRMANTIFATRSVPTQPTPPANE